MKQLLTARSLKRQLLVGILAPVMAFIAINTVVLYRQALRAVNTAYDRTLLASAKSIGEQLDVAGYDDQARIRATVPYSALEAFEADNQSRLYYRVSTQGGTLISGFDDLPFWQGRIPQRPPYAALVDFYDDRHRGQDVRMAVLLQPVASGTGRGMAVIQVAETLELRRALARQILRDTLIRQALLVALIALIVVLVVQRVTRPVMRLSAELQGRPDNDLTPIDAPDAPLELRPLIEAMRQLMQRLQRLLRHQKRFVRDTAHQLRTPLAVLKTQVQSALRGDVPAEQALHEINHTVDRATALANQMLALAKVEQLRQQASAGSTALDAVARDVALDLSPLIAERELDFSLSTAPAALPAHDWMLRELVRNLLHNAIRHSPQHGTLTLDVTPVGPLAQLTLQDQGPGLDEGLRERLFQPFSAGHSQGSVGLGLAICHEIVDALGGTLTLDNVEPHGLRACVRLPMAATAHERAGTIRP